MKINKKQMKKWIKALRSGKYKQTKGQLNNEKGYCCLGVACKVLIPKKKQLLEHNYLAGNTPNRQNYSPKWLKLINSNFNIKTNKLLTILNDKDKYNFNEIADLLEAVYILNVLK